jgi:hypothetical protein
MFTHRERESAAEMPNKPLYKHYVHAPFIFENAGIKVECNEQGKLVLTQTYEDGAVETLRCSASLINFISRMLISSKKAEPGKYSDFMFEHMGFHVEYNEKEELGIIDKKSEAEINCSIELINMISRMLFKGRTIVLKDTPFKGDEI